MSKLYARPTDPDDVKYFLTEVLKNAVREAVLLLAVWKALERKLNDNKTLTKVIRVIRRIYLGI